MAGLGSFPTKLFDNYSVALRQHKAAHSHCELLHGYALKFKVWFESIEPLEEDQTYFDYYSIIDSDTIWFFDTKGQLDYCWKDNLESDLFKPIMNMLKIEE